MWDRRPTTLSAVMGPSLTPGNIYTSKEQVVQGENKNGMVGLAARMVAKYELGSGKIVT